MSALDRLKEFVLNHPGYKSEPWINDRGNTVTPGSYHGDRYAFDFKHCKPEDGWRQYDTSQDAHYFGVWVNMNERLTFTYCEGDISLVECPTAESFKAELDNADEVYGKAPPMAIGYDFKDDGTVTRTEFYDKRPSSVEIA